MKHQREKYDEAVSKKCQVFKCIVCDENFNTSADLKKHRKSHKTAVWSFQFDECETVFNEEWKLNAHSKQHVNYMCDLCDKAFKNEEAKKNHNKIVDENQKLYCHYYNNGKDCPPDRERVFLHIVPEVCMYVFCERHFCASSDIAQVMMLLQKIVKMKMRPIHKTKHFVLLLFQTNHV